MITAFTNDPNLAPVPTILIPQALQVLFVTIIQVVISYHNIIFMTLEKHPFLSTLFEQAALLACPWSKRSSLLLNLFNCTITLRLVNIGIWTKYLSSGIQCMQPFIL